MAKDDYFVIVYQVLAYLYSCLKRNTPPDMAYFDGRVFSVSDDYWMYILRSLYDEGFIEGVHVVEVLGATEPLVKVGPGVRITPKGIQHLSDNKIFEKVKRALKDIRAVLPI